MTTFLGKDLRQKSMKSSRGQMKVTLYLATEQLPKEVFLFLHRTEQGKGGIALWPPVTVLVSYIGNVL